MTTRRPEPAAWDATVEANPRGSYVQLAAWAEVKAVNGWRVARFADEDAGIGAQVLARRPGPLPWAWAYAPRGPVVRDWTPFALAEATTTFRRELPAALGRVSHLTIDPEVELDGPDDTDGGLRAALASSGWTPAPPVQPDRSRVIDLRADEAALWGDLRSKWRQYVNRARTAGVRIVEADEARLPEFYAIYRETAERAGFIIRAESAYRDVWRAFSAGGRARLLFAESAEGEVLATLFLIRCGARVVEPYGGMTQAGADSRANYLLKWEAIRSSREAGAVEYDLWGLSHPGIAHFKAGFGGREIRYIGAWNLVLDPIGHATFRAARRGQVWIARRRHGLSDAAPAGAA
jgi:lipid II:glycine glycyltransferase (peptidoglycan interpeptide bridge formation enzyme)